MSNSDSTSVGRRRRLGRSVQFVQDHSQNRREHAPNGNSNDKHWSPLQVPSMFV